MNPQIILATVVLNLLAVFSTFGKSTAATAKTREHYEAKFLSEYPKVRFATGEGTLATALENVAKLSADRLPISVAPNRL